MNKADRVERAQALILRLLAEAAPRGLRRTAITEALPHDWSFSTKILDEMTADGRVAMVGRFYLNPGTEDAHRDLQRTLQRARETRVLQRNKGVKVEIVIDGAPTGWIVKVPHWMADRHVDLCTPGSVAEPEPTSGSEPEPEPEPEAANFWGTNSIPAGKPGLVLVPNLESGDLAEIEVPAQDFEWTPQVHTTGPHPTGSVAVTTLPVVAVDVDPSPQSSSSGYFWAVTQPCGQ